MTIYRVFLVGLLMAPSALFSMHGSLETGHPSCAKSEDELRAMVINKEKVLLRAIVARDWGLQQKILHGDTFLQQVQVRDSQNYGALHYAAAYRQPHLVGPLVQAGLNINDQKNAARQTPLCMAIESGDEVNKLETIALLLVNGANPRLANGSEHDARYWTLHKGGEKKNDIIKLIGCFWRKNKKEDDCNEQ